MSAIAATPLAAPLGIVKLSLARNVAWSVAAGAGYAGSQWLTLVILARLGSTRALGQYAIAAAITAPILLLAGLQLRSVQATDARAEFELGDYLALRLSALAVAALVILFAAAVGTADREGLLTVLLLALARMFDSLSDVYHGLLQRVERMDRIGQGTLLRSLLGLVAVLVGQRLTGSVVGATALLALSSAAVFVGFDRRSPRIVGAPGWADPLRWRPAALRKLLAISAPLGVVLMLVSLQANVPRYFVQKALGTEQLGIFAAVTSLFAAGQLFVSAVGATLTPRLASAFANRKREAFTRVVLAMAGAAAVMGALGTLVALLAGRPLLRLLFGEPYAEQSRVLLVVMCAATVGYVASVLGYAMTAARRFRAQLPLFLATLVVTAAASAVLVPRLGLVGAAAAWGASLVVQCAGSLVILALALREGPGAPPA